jgi:hypothetical protein
VSKKKPKATRPCLKKANLVLKEKAVQLNNAGWKHSEIAKELRVDPGTIRRWFRELGVPPKKTRMDPNVMIGVPDPDPIGTAITGQLVGTAKELGVVAELEAKELEHAEIQTMANTALTPTDQYQAYVAAQGMRLIRDGIAQVKPPRTIAELDQLDKIVRRSMGLEGKNGGGGGGGGGGSLRIDLTILNNPVASPHGANVDPGTGYLVDVEALEAETRERHKPLGVTLPLPEEKGADA